MQFEMNAVFSLSVGIGAITGWIRFKKTDPAFFPFLILLWAGFVNELASILIISKGYSNAIYYNLFTLAEAIFISWQFYRWGLYGKRQRLYFSIQCLFIAGWLTEFLMRQNLQAFHSYFIIVYSTIIVFMSIHVLSNELFKEPGILFLNPVFLICMGFFVYFTYTILVEVFWMYGLNKSSVFRIRIYLVFSYINLITNLVFAFATLWIPKKPTYIMQS